MKDPKFIKLLTVSDRVKFDLIKGIFEEENIPYLVKDDEAGSLMRIIGGFSNYAASFFVPDFLYEKSRNIIAEDFEGIEFDPYEEEK